VNTQKSSAVQQFGISPGELHSLLLILSYKKWGVNAGSVKESALCERTLYIFQSILFSKLRLFPVILFLIDFPACIAFIQDSKSTAGILL